MRLMIVGGGLEAVRDLYNTDSCLQRLAVLRDDDLWSAHLLRSALGDRLFDRHERFLVSEDAGEVTAYLRCRVAASGDLVVREYGLRAGAREHLTALVRSALEREGPGAPQRLTSVVPARFANLCPSESMRWKRWRSSRPMMKSFGSFRVPDHCDAEERWVWASDWF